LLPRGGERRLGCRNILRRVLDYNRMTENILRRVLDYNLMTENILTRVLDYNMQEFLKDNLWKIRFFFVFLPQNLVRYGKRRKRRRLEVQAVETTRTEWHPPELYGPQTEGSAAEFFSAALFCSVCCCGTVITSSGITSLNTLLQPCFLFANVFWFSNVALSITL